MTVKASKRDKKRNLAPDNEETRADLSCKTCGQVFASFLEEMAERNAQQMPAVKPEKMTGRPVDLTCPKCGKTHDYTLKPSSSTTKSEPSGKLARN
jgi:ribosomal protein S27E